MSDGTLYGVGLGPGDPELVTVKAARLIGAADVARGDVAACSRAILHDDGLAEPALQNAGE